MALELAVHFHCNLLAQEAPDFLWISQIYLPLLKNSSGDLVPWRGVSIEDRKSIFDPERALHCAFG